MSGPCRHVVGVALAIVMAWPCLGYAESSGADELFQQGVRALRAHRYDDAANFFRLSYQMEPRASTMCNLALTHERAGNIQQARDSYRQCAADDREGRYRDHANEQAAAMDRRLASSRTPPPRQPGTPVQQQPSQYQVVQPQRSHTLAWLGIGVEVLGLGALGAAIGLNVWSNRVYDELEEQYGSSIPQDSSAADRVDRGRAGGQAALGLYIGGGVLAALGAILIVLDLAGIQVGGGYALTPSRNGLALSFSFSAL